MKELTLWQFVQAELENKQDVILASVLSHQQGSPGKQGFKMVVSSSRKAYGSIGGGVMEKNFVEFCAEKFSKDESVYELKTLHHKTNTEFEKSGLICAGSQTIYLHTLKEKDLGLVSKIIKAYEKPSDNYIRYQTGKIKILKRKDFNENYFFEISEKDNQWICYEKAGYKNFAYIFGAGHVGFELSRVLYTLDFHVTIFDDRKNFPFLENNFFANEKYNIPYNKVGRYVKDSNYSYIFVVTTGYISDKESIKQVIGKKSKYIGLMGTQRKIKKIYNECVKEGVDRTLLKKVNAPIGLEINSNTPEEIAVSIAAEVIKIKNTNG
jgi:xanthine dehydrogenase accessory factor